LFQALPGGSTFRQEIGKIIKDWMAFHMGKNGLKNIAYDYLLTQICTGKMGPNTPIVEQDISSLLNISRTPVREALKQLEMEGLVTHFVSRGTFIREITMQDINEIYQIRKLFELASLEQAVHQIPEEELDEIEELLEGISDTSNDEDFFRADRNLHSTLLRYAYNSRMIEFYDILDAQIERIRRISSATPQRLTVSKAEHLAILKAIRQRDPEAARQALAEHIDNVHKSACRVFESMRMGLKC
jgi:DNA-binding GntR family transcriptional regulator